MSRPEFEAPPEIYYGEDQASKYSTNSHIIKVQSQLTERAIELCLLSDHQPSYVLDIGCGSGISGSILSEHGHYWLGIDISCNMLEIAVQKDVEGDMILADVGENQNLRCGVFDAAISISALQWLCNQDKSDHSPYKRLRVFFRWLKACLTTNSRAVFQFYPNHVNQLDMITNAALGNGFNGGIVIDYPESSRAKKYYLCIWTGLTGIPATLPKNLTTEGVNNKDIKSVQAKGCNKKKRKVVFKSKEWILKKKDSLRNKNVAVRPDSKYTGRRRKNAF